MKLQYLGGLRRDGSWPSVKVGGDFVQIVEGFVDVPDSEADRLIATNNFKLAGKSQPAPVAAPVEVPAAEEAKPATDKEELIARAKTLGIPANKSWSINAIQKAILAKAD